MWDEKRFGARLASLRKERGLTQEQLAALLHVSAQAVSKWENSHSLPETSLLPSLARLLEVRLDTLFDQSELVVLEAEFGDGLEHVSVADRLNRLVEDDRLSLSVLPQVLGLSPGERMCFLTVKYQTKTGVGFRAVPEGGALELSAVDPPTRLPERELEILAGQYGVRSHPVDVMAKLAHYRPFHWEAYWANHETFPSAPGSDRTEYLTLVYLNQTGIHLATCVEGECLAYQNDRSVLARRCSDGACCLPEVPALPVFGQGMECSWAAALTVALWAMGVQTSYQEVMGVSGACYRLAFSSPDWDYSSVDGLVVYDYATPGFAAFGFTPEQYCRVSKPERAAHRERMTQELRSGMPVLGIHLRVAPEWGVICGFDKQGEELFCRTKYDAEMQGAVSSNPYGYPYVDNWPFLFCYFTQKRSRPSARECVFASLRVFQACAVQQPERGYQAGLQAYERWASDLEDEIFFMQCDDELLARRFSVNQFCTLALTDARAAASGYLNASSGLFDGETRAALQSIADGFTQTYALAQEVYQLLDSGRELSGAECRQFWTPEKRGVQVDRLRRMAATERKALAETTAFLQRYDKA